MLYCKDCKFFYGAGAQCDHTITEHESPVYGLRIGRSAQIERKDIAPGHCGPEGKNFIKRRWWE